MVRLVPCGARECKQTSIYTSRERERERESVTHTHTHTHRRQAREGKEGREVEQGSRRKEGERGQAGGAKQEHTLDVGAFKLTCALPVTARESGHRPSKAGVRNDATALDSKRCAHMQEM